MVKPLSIQADKVVVEKEHRRILNELTFSIPAGTLTGLIGPSGSGKTTLIRAIVGVQALKNGSLRVLGKDAGSKQLRSQIGYVTQAPAVYEDLTVEQNLRYFAVLVKASRSQVNEVIAQVRLEDRRRGLIKDLSGGERARVSLGLALLGNPDVLVLDEPTVGLDPLLRRDLWTLFGELAEQGKTLLISSHVMDEAERCQRLLLLRDGELLWQDSKERLLETAGVSSVEEAFIHMIDMKEQK
jgi:ABC-2 type transport system ATP-binding protein